VMVTATVDGNAGDGQQVNINVCTPSNPGSTNSTNPHNRSRTQ
jgi:hypothetical protein